MRPGKTAGVLKMARRKSGVSQSRIAKQFGFTSAQFVSNWERGMAQPPRKILKPLCRIIKLEPKKLERALVADYRRDLGL